VAHIGAPSRLGWRFTPQVNASNGQVIRAQFDETAHKQPLLNPDGGSRKFSICYAPNAGNDGDGQMTLSLDGDPARGLRATTSRLAVPAAFKKKGSSFTHFGVL